MVCDTPVKCRNDTDIGYQSYILNILNPIMECDTPVKHINDTGILS